MMPMLDGGMDAQDVAISYILENDALTEIIVQAGEGAAFGVGLALIFWVLGYGIWFVVDLVRGGAL